VPRCRELAVRATSRHHLDESIGAGDRSWSQYRQEGLRVGGMPDAGPNVPKPLSSRLPTPPESPHYNSFIQGLPITLLCLWVVAVLFLGIGALMPSTWRLWSIPVISLAIAVGLILSMVNLFRRRWRAGMSIVLASAALAFAILGELKFSNELRWYVLRPYYVGRIAESSRGPDNIHGVEWDGGLGWDVTLEYHETEIDARAWQRKQHEGSGSCKQTLTDIAPHYFLNGIYC
jgi:hypothetical protein